METRLRAGGDEVLAVVPPALLRLRRRYSTDQRVKGVIQLCFADFSRADADVFDAGVSLLAYRDTLAQSEAEFLRAARSLPAWGSVAP